LTHDSFGFYGAILTMAAVSLIIVWWLKKQQWL
jgi:Mg2+ and Co2+ transporter CorA